MLDDDEESKTIVVSKPQHQHTRQQEQPEQQEQPTPVILEEDTQTTIPVIRTQPPAPEPTPTYEQNDEATKTFAAPKAKRTRQKRITKTGTIATPPAGNATDVGARFIAPDENTPAPPLSLSPTWMDALQEQQASVDDMPQWLSSLHMIGTKTEEMEGTDLQPSPIGEEEFIVTNDAASALQPVEAPAVPVEHSSPSIQAKDENGTSQDK